ncbi:MAG: IS1 family transposase, partial [Sediminibacterium sp.]|nr:IS1 family transposase [Sediminibacterium sp.]
KIKHVKIKEENGKKVIKETETQEIDIPLVRVGYETKKCKCKNCKLVKAGKSGNKQRYMCKGCGRKTTENSREKKYSTYKKNKAIELYLEGLSIRSVARITKTSHVTLQRWIQQAAKKVKPQHITYSNAIEIDELYYFVGKRKQTKGKLSARKRWLWLAVCRTTRRILAFEGGSRERTTLKKLTSKIQHIACTRYYSDEHTSFTGLLPGDKYKASKKETYTIEGINSVIRHFLARFRRRTKCYSKSEKMLNATMTLFCHHHNLKQAA